MNLFSMWGVEARNPTETIRHKRRRCVAALAICCAVSISICTLGCGMAAGPQPPSLQLPKPILDLTAARVGNRVNLQWNTPSETTDKLKIRGPVKLQVCRQLHVVPCQTIATIFSAPGKPAAYADSLPSTLTTGPLHAITYEVAGVNKHGRSAGPSNRAAALAGAAPPAIQNLSATMAERGVILHWQAVADLQPDTSIQLQRTLLVTKAGSNSKTPAALPPAAEPTEQTLRIAPISDGADMGKALDSNVVFSRNYRYVAARVTRLKVGAQWIQVASAPSAPVDIYTQDKFPPAAPSGLAAVPVAAEINGGQPEVDLSWSSNVEPDFSQYIIYRRDVGSGQAAPERMAPEDLTNRIVAPAFRDLHAQPGHTYAYSVVAVDGAGNRSASSPEIVVTVPSS